MIPKQEWKDLFCYYLKRDDIRTISAEIFVFPNPRDPVSPYIIWLQSNQKTLKKMIEYRKSFIEKKQE